MFQDGCRPASIEGMYRIECTFEKLFLSASTTFHSAFCSRNLRVHDLGCH